MGLVLGLFRSARLGSRYCVSHLLWLVFSISLGLFRSTRASCRFHLSIFLGLFRSTRFCSRHCGLPFAKDAGLGLLIRMLARLRPHIIAYFSVRLVQRGEDALTYRLLLNRLPAIRLLARPYTGAPSRSDALRGLLHFAWALRLSLGPGWRRGSACSP